jgi:hypothetical protein
MISKIAEYAHFLTYVLVNLTFSKVAPQQQTIKQTNKQLTSTLL